MKPYYRAGYTQEEIAKIFGIKKNDSIIPPMPQPPMTRPLSPIDRFAREQIQERKEGRKKAVQHLAQLSQKAKSTSKEVRHIGLRIPAEQMPELEALANELHVLGEIPEAMVPSLMRYSTRFFTYYYVKWVDPLSSS